jgi:hypothetical protein
MDSLKSSHVALPQVISLHQIPRQCKHFFIEIWHSLNLVGNAYSRSAPKSFSISFLISVKFFHEFFIVL